MELLIADDEVPIRLILSKQVQRLGYCLKLVENGQEALDVLLADDAPRVAVLDWMMPKLSGVDVCRAVRSTNLRYQPYLIVLTARIEPEDLETALNAGADDYMSKPYSPVELRARLNVGKRYLEAAQQVKTLQGLLPICCKCKKIRDSQNYWHEIEEYISSHSEAEFSHSLCDDCFQLLYPKRRVKKE